MPRRRKKSTIGQNPLDQIGKPRGKSRKNLMLPSGGASDIRDLILKKRPSAKKSPLKGWFKTILGRITG